MRHRAIRYAKFLIQVISRRLGLFSLAEFFSRKNLRILCYHGFSIDDEHKWSPGMFIQPETFQRRLDYLHAKGFHVLKLDDAIRRLAEGTLPKNALVITIDDGFYSTKTIAHPMLYEKKFPYTIYVTSYYSNRESPVANLVIPYLVWKAGVPANGPELLEFLDLEKPEDSHGISDATAMQNLIEIGNRLDNADRTNLLERLSRFLGVDFSELHDSKILQLLTASEIEFLIDQGVDIQLHTHRHRWPHKEAEALTEISLNRKYLEPLAKKKLEHFCYPSGRWTPPQIHFLKTAGIKSATTCDPGLNTKDTCPFALYRLLDGDDLHQIEFEAMVSGYWLIIKGLFRFAFRPFSFKSRKRQSSELSGIN
jgi:peptidoglycan/xylan/chitin deacetylase (PgdA/CDA1 family)